MSLSPNKPTSLPLQGTMTNIKKKKSFQFNPFDKMRKLMKFQNKANDDNSPTAPHQSSTSPTTPATTPTDHPTKGAHRPVGGSTHDILYTTNVSNNQNSELGRKMSVSMDDVSFTLENNTNNNKQQIIKNNNENNKRKNSKKRTQSSSSKGRSGDDDDDKVSDDGLPLSPLSFNEKAPSSPSFDSGHGRLSEDSCLNILDDNSKISEKSANDTLDLDDMFGEVKKLDITVAKQRRNVRPNSRRAFTAYKSITDQDILSEFTNEDLSFSLHNENIGKPNPHTNKLTNNLVKTHKRTLSNKECTEEKKPDKIADFKPSNNVMTSTNDTKKVNEKPKVDMVRPKKGFAVDLKELQAKRKTIALLNADKIESKDFKKKFGAQATTDVVENIFEKKSEALKKFDSEKDTKVKPPTIAAKPAKFIKPSVPIPSFKLKDKETSRNITATNSNTKNNDNKTNNDSVPNNDNNNSNNKNDSNHVNSNNTIEIGSSNDIIEKVDKKIVQESYNNNKENNINNNPVTSVSKTNTINSNNNNDAKSQLDAPKQEPAWKVRLAELREKKQSTEVANKLDTVVTNKPKVPADKPVFAALKKTQESVKGVDENVGSKSEDRPVFKSLKGEKIDDRTIFKEVKNEEKEEKPLFKKSFKADDDNLKGPKLDDDGVKAGNKFHEENQGVKALKEELEKSPFKMFKNEKEEPKPVFKSFKAEKEEISFYKGLKKDNQGETKDSKPEKPDISDLKNKKPQKNPTNSETTEDNLEFKQIKLNSINKLNHSKTFLHHNNYNKNNIFINKQGDNEKGADPPFSIANKISNFKETAISSPPKQPLKETLSATAKLFPHKEMNKDTIKETTKVFPYKEINKDTGKDTNIQTNKFIKKDKVLPPTNKHIPPPSFKNNF